MYSNSFSKYYDELMGDYSSITNTTKKLLQKYTKPHSMLLELGCGTGNLLIELKDDYKLHGLDNSKGMLTIAKKKVPYASFFHSDMSSFMLKNKFDVVVCIFDSINHLTNFTSWEKTFAHVAKHLNNEGVFIFDMNTIKRLEKLAKFPPFVKKVNDNTLFCMTLKKEHNVYRGYFQVFEGLNNENITYVNEIVDENSFEVDMVKKSLLKYFTIEEMVDPYRKKITQNTGRIFFVCKKKQAIGRF